MKARFVLLFLFFSGSLYGQGGVAWLNDYKTLDTVQYKFIYSFKWAKNLETPEKKSEDRHVLEIGNNISKYYSMWYMEYIYFQDSFLKKTPKLGGVPGNPKETYDYEFIKNYPKGKITVIGFRDIPNINHLYEDIVDFHWELHADVKTILDYQCHKATTNFRGRDYTAWFTTDIPINNGPWKFSGLPGLIMKVEDSENSYSFECIGIEYPKNETIKLYNMKYTRVSRSDYQKIHYNMHHNPDAVFRALGIVSVPAIGVNPTELLPIPYNPIERDYD